MNLLRRGPAAYCLLSWGRPGLEALVENATDGRTSKDVSLALRLLASVSVGREPTWIPSSPSDDHLREVVSQVVGDWEDLASVARNYLHEMMLSIEDDAHAAIYTATALSGLAHTNDGAIGNITRALALRSIAVGPRVIAAYDELVAGTGDNEAVFQRFFEDNPLMLDPRAFQVWAQPDFHGRLEPDFVIRTYDNRYVIVEIETPAKLLVTRQNQLSADATHAISQVIGYRGIPKNSLGGSVRNIPWVCSFHWSCRYRS